MNNYILDNSKILTDKKALNAVKQLHAQIEHYSEKEIKSLSISSLKAGAGVSAVAESLALLECTSHDKVLLIDAHISDPHAHVNFGFENKNGITNLIRDNITLDPEDESCFRQFRCSDFNGTLYVLPAGTGNSVADIFSTGGFDKFMAECKTMFDFIIIDCAPFTEMSDFISAASQCDGTVLVLNEKSTKSDALKSAVSTLKRNGINLLGFVLNDVKHLTSENL